MVQNEELAKTVLVEIVQYAFNNDEILREMSRDDQDVALAIVAQKTSIMDDKPYKVRMHVGNMIGYGYDFSINLDDGRNVREVYEAVVARTKKMSESGSPQFETFLAEGIDNAIYGWYLTKPFGNQPLLFKRKHA